MIVEDIVNELDKFITKYKTLKSYNQTLHESNNSLESTVQSLNVSNQALESEKQTLQTDNQSLTQFKLGVKSALTGKGIITSTTSDSDVISSINNYNPPSSGATLDADYLKNVGLLPILFSGTPTEKDLIVNRYLFQDAKSPNKFISSNSLSSIKVQLNGATVSNYKLNRENSTDYNNIVSANKYTISNYGYYINTFKFIDSGEYTITLSDGVLSLTKTINYSIDTIKSFDNFLIYAVNLKSHRNVCYDTNKVETVNNLDVNKIDSTMRAYVSKVATNLDTMNIYSEKLGYVYNVRTGKAYLLDVKWESNPFSVIDSKFRKSLSTVIYNNKVYVLTNRYSFSLLVHGMDESNFITDIDYQDGDTLVFAFYKDRNSNLAHDYLVEQVANYFKTSSTALSSEEPTA